MTNTLLLVLYFSMPVMIYAAPQLNTGNIIGGLGLGALGGGSNGVLGAGNVPVLGSLAGGGTSAVTGAAAGALSGTMSGSLVGKMQDTAENVEDLAESVHVLGHGTTG